MMSTTSKAKPDNQNLARTKSLGRKPKVPSSEDGSDQKPEKHVPNYLKPTLSSRPDLAKLPKKKNNILDDHQNQKLLRRRSFDQPPSSSLTSPSTSSSRIQKSLNVSPSRPRDRPGVPREKPVTALRSSSFQGTRGAPRGVSTTVKSSPVAPKKSGLSSSSKSKKEGSANVTTKKASSKEIALDSASLSSAQEDDQEEILKVESHNVQVADDIKEPKDEKENKEMQVDVVQADQSGEDKEGGRPESAVSPRENDCIAVKKEDEKEEEVQKPINGDNTEENIEETKEQENNQANKDEEEEEVKNKIDEDEIPEKVDIETKDLESVEETTEEQQEEVKEEKKEEKVKEEEEVKEEKKEEKVKEEEEVKEEEKITEEEVKEEKKESKVKEEEVKEEKKESKVKEEETGEAKKREVMKGKKESPISAYNDVIASKMQENPRKNKVLALAGAFQTVIDYETAASK